MNFTRTAAVALRIFYLMKGSPARLLQMFVWVLIDITLWGFISHYLSSVSAPGMHFVPTLLGAVLMWDFFTRVIHGLAIAFFEDVWSRNFLNFFASPLKLREYLSGLVVVATLTSMLALTAMLLLASLAFGLSIFSYGIMILPFLMILFLFGIAIGIIGSSFVLRFGPSAEWFIWPIPALLSPFAAVFYPLDVLPTWMQLIAHTLPPAYVFENVRGILAGKPIDWAGLSTGTALSFAYIIAACWIFAQVQKHAIKTGLIARYSAESVS